MSDKTTIETLIDTNLASAQPITATLVRNTLKDNADSLLINFYPTESSDSEATESILTLTTALSANFDLKVLKTGRRISISATVTALLEISNLGIILAGELTATTGTTYYTVGYVISPSISGKQISVVNSGGVTSILINPSLAIGETIQFTIFYNSNV